MTVFYGERGQPVATIENGCLFLANGKPVAFLEDDFIFAINSLGYNSCSGKCLGSLVKGVMYDNNGHAFAFRIGCSDGDPKIWRTVNETVPEDVTQGRDISGLPSEERPAFFLEKLSPIARLFLMKELK